MKNEKIDKPVILVIDDQICNSELLEAHLIQHGYKIITAQSGESALDIISRNRVDLILLDVMMPGMNGFEVTRRVRLDNTNWQIPIIMVTVLCETEDRIRGIEAGCDDFISKPIDVIELLTRVRSLLKIKACNDRMNDYRNELEVTKITADEAREYAESIINTVREPLIVLDQDLRVIKASRSFYDVFKVNPDQTVGQLIYDLGNKQWDIPKLRELLETILPQQSSFDDYEVEHNFDEIGTRVMRLNARQIQRGAAKKRLILLAIEDVTERKQAQEKIRLMAFHDTLTGLANRKLFSDRLNIVRAHSQRSLKKAGILMLDLDHFKDVNDSMGHDAGDILLQETAARLISSLRQEDTVARFGGDEFVLILPELEAIEDAASIAQNIIDAFGIPFLIADRQFVVTISIGIAIFPDDGQDESTLLKNADIAMYRAKQTGRAQYRLYEKNGMIERRRR